MTENTEIDTENTIHQPPPPVINNQATQNPTGDLAQWADPDMLETFIDILDDVPPELTENIKKDMIPMFYLKSEALSDLSNDQLEKFRLDFKRNMNLLRMSYPDSDCYAVLTGEKEALGYRDEITIRNMERAFISHLSKAKNGSLMKRLTQAITVTESTARRELDQGKQSSGITSRIANMLPGVK